MTHVPRVIHFTFFSLQYGKLISSTSMATRRIPILFISFLRISIKFMNWTLLEKKLFLKPIKHHNNQISMLSFNLNEPVVWLGR